MRAPSRENHRDKSGCRYNVWSETFVHVKTLPVSKFPDPFQNLITKIEMIKDY
jgi:hypothetical protein